MSHPISACGHSLCFERCGEVDDLVLLLDDAADRAIRGENGRKWARAFGLSDAEGRLFEVVAYSSNVALKKRAAAFLGGALDDRFRSLR